MRLDQIAYRDNVTCIDSRCDVVTNDYSIRERISARG
jgi:hypothetical protein